MRNSKPQYEYADGNGNRYILTAYSLEYVPVTPEESSTGIYQGGKAFKMPLAPAEYKSLQLLFEKALNDAGSHIFSRPKMSGLVIKRQGAETERAVISPGALIHLEIDAALKQFHTK